MSDEIRKEAEELRKQDAELEQQEQDGRKVMAEVQRKLAEIHERRVYLCGAVQTLEKMLPKDSLKITDGESVENAQE